LWVGDEKDVKKVWKDIDLKWILSRFRPPLLRRARERQQSWSGT